MKDQQKTVEVTLALTVTQIESLAYYADELFRNHSRIHGLPPCQQAVSDIVAACLEGPVQAAIVAREWSDVPSHAALHVSE